MAEKRGVAAKDGHRFLFLADGSVRVWSSVSVTVSVTDDPPQFIKYEFGHERIARSDSNAELRRVANLIDEFNEREIEKRIEQYQRLVSRHSVEVGEAPDEARKGSVKERVRQRIKEES